MIKVFTALFDALREHGVICCNWKSHYDVQNQLNGNGDLDLFVPFNSKVSFEAAINPIGFRRVISYQASHGFIEHYYGLDPDSGKFAHIHVYFKIVTGEHISKNYILPLDPFIIANLNDAIDIPTVNERAKITIFLIRHFLKIGSPFGLLQYWRELNKHMSEWRLLDFKGLDTDIPEINLTSGELEKMAEVYISSGLVANFLLAINFKYKLRRFRRRPFFKHQVYIAKNVLMRVTNRIFLKRKKLFSPGRVVAICGLDGTGKSSLVEALDKHFSVHFCVKRLHLGRPSSSSLSFIFWPFLAIRTQLFALVGGGAGEARNRLEAKDISIIYALRSVLLAYDRKVEANRAHNLSDKGYLVICDRYPGLFPGKMDSPRIPRDLHRGRIYQYCYRVEQHLYHTIQPAEMLFHLKAPVEVAIERNNNREKAGKETEDELRERFFVNSGATFLAATYKYVDATAPQDTVFNEVLNGIWIEKFDG
jgi:thymidylate kinase